MTAPPTIAVRLVVSGLVQGVHFRALTRRRAEISAVTGWVRNRPDGRVEAHLEGRPAAVREVVDWCRHGPSQARVDAVEVEQTEVEGFAAFEIAR